MPEPGSLECDHSSREFLASALLRQLQAMQAEVEGVRQAQDIECIHRMRVASRRARNLLPLMAGCAGGKRLRGWSQTLRGITRALGAARDADVQIDGLETFAAALEEPRARLGIRRLLLRLRQQRAIFQAELLRVLDKLQRQQGLEKIEQQVESLRRAGEQPAGEGEESGEVSDSPASHLLYRRAAYFIQRNLNAFLAYEPFIFDPARITELHAMRICAKHLRYTLETFGPLYSDGLQDEIRLVRRVQEALGTIHDCDVWAAFLPLFLEEERALHHDFYGHLRAYSPLLPGLNRFAQNRAQLRAETYQEFLKQWQKSQRRPPQGAWEALRQRVNQALLPHQVYPPAPEESSDGGV